MSQPKRWKLWQVEAQEPNMEWVKWDDYAALAAENERLRKAGDYLRDCLTGDLKGEPWNDECVWHSIETWNAAKEGRDAK